MINNHTPEQRKIIPNCTKGKVEPQHMCTKIMPTYLPLLNLFDFLKATEREN